MLRDLSFFIALFVIIGAGFYLLKYPISRGLSFRGEPTLYPRYEHKHKKAQPFKSYQSSSVTERKCQFKKVVGKGTKICHRPESEHGITEKHPVKDHFFTR